MDNRRPNCLSLIVACGLNNGISRGGRMPWHLPADLKRFKALTLGKPVIMGRRTYESIGKPLPGRRNLVVTRDVTAHFKGCEVVHSLQAALQLAADGPEIMVIGGGQIYREAWTQAARIYLTRIHATFEADTFFPEIAAAEWHARECITQEADATNPYDYAFIVLERR